MEVIASERHGHVRAIDAVTFETIRHVSDGPSHEEPRDTEMGRGVPFLLCRHVIEEMGMWRPRRGGMMTTAAVARVRSYHEDLF